jgi:hypothetical protein
MTASMTSPRPELPDRKKLAEAKIVVPSHVVFRTFAAETVALNLETGVYHGLNVTAGRMLDVLQQTGSFNETVDRLVAEYNQTVVDISQDLRTLCGELLQRGLIELA